jgi:hypothetical protein
MFPGKLGNFTCNLFSQLKIFEALVGKLSLVNINEAKGGKHNMVLIDRKHICCRRNIFS